MRYYSIVITDPTGKVINSSASPTLAVTFASTTNGQSKGAVMPGALDVELDVPVTAFAEPDGNTGAQIIIHGLPLQEVQKAPYMFGPVLEENPTPTLTQFKTIALYAGMSPGLPLATAISPKAGLIVEGIIYQAFGNWIGTDMNVSLIVRSDTTKPHTLNWPKGTPLSAAIASTLSVNYPGVQQVINISPNLVLAHDEIGFYGDLHGYAEVVRNISRSTIGGSYRGVDIMLRGKKFIVYDAPTAVSPIKIAFQDLLGQPTWVAPAQIQFMTSMRSDISVGDVVQLPPGAVPLIVTSAPAVPNAQPSGKNVFIQPLIVRRVHHWGSFRNPDGRAWASVFDCYFVPKGGTTSGAG